MASPDSTPPKITHNTVTCDPYNPDARGDVSYIFVEDEPRLRLEGEGRDVHAYEPRTTNGVTTWHRIQWHQPDSVRTHEQARQWWVNAYTRMEAAA